MSLPTPRCTSCAAPQHDAAPNAYVSGIYSQVEYGYTVHRVSGSGIAGSHLVEDLNDLRDLANGLEVVGTEGGGVLVDPDSDVLVVLQEAGAAWAAARELEREAAAAVYGLIVRCDARGISESEIARRLDVDRMTVRRALGKL